MAIHCYIFVSITNTTHFSVRKNRDLTIVGPMKPDNKAVRGT